jgi:hypothetical protein
MLFAIAASGTVPTGLECFLCGIVTIPAGIEAGKL